MPDLLHHRWMQVAAAVAVAAAGIGFLTGTRGAPVPEGLAAGAAQAQPVPRKGLRPAPRYRDLRHRLAPGRARHAEAFAKMRGEHRPVTQEIPRVPDKWEAAVAARMRRRAYEGAPPRAPHPVDGVQAAACLTCHREGLKVFDKVARPMPHPAYANCQQCHASEQPGRSLASMPDSVPPDNGFEGLQPPLHGPRFLPTAPPQMPHPSFMRERCTSCHGVWADGLASSHPWRQNCRQCHTSSADADQHPRGGVGFEAPPAPPREVRP